MKLWGYKFSGLMLLALSMLCLQGFSIDHELEHHGKAHSHDGMLCVLDVFQDRDDDIITPPVFVVFSPEAEIIYLKTAPTLLVSKKVTAWASPRAPPAVL